MCSLLTNQINMNNSTVIERPPVRLGDSEAFLSFKQGLDSVLERRKYILPLLKEGRDYHVIKGRKSLGKSGAELIASAFGYVAEFQRDTIFDQMPGVVSFICNLTNKDGKPVGQGRGASSLEKTDGDPNKCLKMAEKSSFVSAIIRSSSLSDLFSQDLENLDINQVMPDYVEEVRKPDTISERQKSLLISLIYQNVHDSNRAENWIAGLDELTKAEASEEISSFIGVK